MAALAAGLFGLSFATALVTLSIFKLVSFFIMPSLFFDLLFIGFPGRVRGGPVAASGPGLAPAEPVGAPDAHGGVGGLLPAGEAVRLPAGPLVRHRSGPPGRPDRGVRRAVPAVLRRVRDERVPWIPVRPVALGGSDAAGLRPGALGAAAAYVFLRAALPALGMARVQLLAFLAMAGSIAALGAGTPARAAAGVEAVALGLALLTPGLEGRFLALYKGRGDLSTYDFETNLGCRSVYQSWGRYSLCEILVSPRKSEYYGFYNDMLQWEYNPRMGFTGPSLGAIPILQTQPGQSIAIIGAGGGRQVRLAGAARRPVGCRHRAGTGGVRGRA